MVAKSSEFCQQWEFQLLGMENHQIFTRQIRSAELHNSEAENAFEELPRNPIQIGDLRTHYADPRTCKLLRKRVSGINAIDRILRAVTRLLLVAEIEQFECNLLDAVTLQIIKENTREPRRSSKSNNTHCLVFKLLYLCNQKESRDHPQHPVYRIGYRNTFSEQFAHPGVSKASIVAMMSDPKNGRLPPPESPILLQT